MVEKEKEVWVMQMQKKKMEVGGSWPQMEFCVLFGGIWKAAKWKRKDGRPGNEKVEKRQVGMLHGGRGGN
jgi:hypothetical protein